MRRPDPIEPISVDWFGMTDIGRAREANEDQFLVAEVSRSMDVHQTSLAVEDHARFGGRRRSYVMLVADGLGGAPAGGLASSIAVGAIIRHLLDAKPWLFWLAGQEEDLRRALASCQSRIEVDVARNPERRGMGTTVTMAYVVWPRLFVAHVGDSRCYLLRDSKLERITRDHTLAQRLADEQVMTEREARESRWSSVIWNVVGGRSSELEPDIYASELRFGDTLLVCTDGVTRHVGEPEIAALLSAKEPAERICRRLIDAASDGGGTDNATAVVARFGEPEPPATRAAAARAAIATERGLS